MENHSQISVRTLVSEMTYNVLMGTLNPTHSLTHAAALTSTCCYDI